MSHPDDDRTIDPSLTGAGTIGIVTAPQPTSTHFAPGSIVAGRYRLVALLGRGGMGEVYRADDLTLDQPVALKFLPAGVAVNDARLAQFHNELRIARQVSHKNVCRLYDLGDADGRRFLTMEYVDGEDLASLLRRIGRIPEDKAIQMARQLCAAVTAAHERGVLHRDLKPANVMIDGDGNVRITDFGIATAAADTSAAVAGTPQYMAPEQIAGRAASIKTDIYALGLILFEIFTGRRAHGAQTLAELKQLHDTGTVTTPSSIVRDLDPAIERVILRCLEKDPDRRPASALTIAAALPGGDPLAAALAAAAESEALDVRWGVAALVTVVAGLLVFAGLSGRTSIIGRVPLDKEPAVLVDRADQILASLGYPEPPADRVYGLTTEDDYIAWLQNTRPDPKRWDSLSAGVPPAVLFWYRTSPRPMVPLGQSVVDAENPPMTVTNMRLLLLDTRGRLQDFRSVPPQVEAAAESAEPPRWAVLFEAAGLPMTEFSSVPPQWTPWDYADTRMAWEGPLPGQPTLRVRVEASAYRGKPVSFSIVGPWTRETRANPDPTSDEDKVLDVVFLLIILALSVAAILLARHNFRTGRADRRAASRVGLYMAGSGLAYWLAINHHVATAVGEFESFLYTVAIFTLVAALMGTIYLALEPYVRRFWPDSLLGWSRLLTGHIRDPRVGRDLLAGAVFGVARSLMTLGKARILPQFGYPALHPGYGTAIDVLSGPGRLLATWIAGAVAALEAALLTVLVFVVLRLLLRRTWLSLAVGIVLLSLVSMNQMGGSGTWLVLLFPLASGVFLTVVVVRFGLLAYAVTWYFSSVVTRVPFRLDLSHWAAMPSSWTLALLMALTLFGFYASRAGQPLFGRVLSE